MPVFILPNHGVCLASVSKRFFSFIDSIENIFHVTQCFVSIKLVLY